MSAQSGKKRVPPIVTGLILWIGVPIGLFAAGYRLVGPRIGEVPVLQKGVEEVGSLLKGQEQKSPELEAPPEDNPNQPEIEVSVEKSNGRSSRTGSSSSNRPRARKKKPRASVRTESPSTRGAETGGGTDSAPNPDGA